MPSLIYKIGKDTYDWCYILPPILYPDGHFWFKLGGGRKIPLHSHSDVVRWYKRQGCSQPIMEQYEANKRGMLRMVDSLFPGLREQAIEVKGDTCATAHTRNSLPYIGRVPDPAPPGLFVATGGNGYAAKSADEIGRLAAMSVCADRRGGSAWLDESGCEDKQLAPRMFRPELLVGGDAQQGQGQRGRGRVRTAALLAAAGAALVAAAAVGAGGAYAL